MAGSSFGKNFRITTWGESHGEALGAVVDGCPAGIKLSEADLQKDLDRRKPGRTEFATPRQEADQVKILSGVFEGYTTGTPISLIIYNNNQRPYDYSEIAQYYRPGHADYTYDQKYGFRDYRGGGRSSGRETAARVGAGAIAKKLLAEFGIEINAYTYSIGNVKINPERFQKEEVSNNPVAMPDPIAAEQAVEFLRKIKDQEDSAGGVVECIVNNVPAGLGEPVFEKLDAMLGRAIFSIGAVKAVEIGSGINASKMTGWEHNDFYRYSENQILTKESNNAGGILGGISDGFPIKLRAHIKPTPSIHKQQRTVNKAGENINIQVKGRHDPIIVPRAVIVVEAMVALTLADYLLQNTMSNIKLLKRALQAPE